MNILKSVAMSAALISPIMSDVLSLRSVKAETMTMIVGNSTNQVLVILILTILRFCNKLPTNYIILWEINKIILEIGRFNLTIGHF